nr:N-formylglutamate amidohydrolase [Marinicella sp. W31]MDC2878651.1 N-formylglutamate amidohydrolase [Marinicella sp. W31]
MTGIGRQERHDYAQEALFEVIRPETQSVPLIFNSPHSGRVYSEAFLAVTRLSHHDIRRSEDLYVDELFSMAPAFGAPLQRAFFRAPFSMSIVSLSSSTRACFPAHCQPT